MPTDPLLLAALAAVVVLLVVVRLLRRRRTAVPMVVVDGSNVMYWKDEKPRLDTVREVVAHLEAQGFKPGVMFDANAGYLLTGKYQHHPAFAKLLGLTPDRVLVVPKGQPADPTILAAARELDARIVTNDRFRDWAEHHPEVRQPGHLIRGGYREGRPWLEL